MKKLMTLAFLICVAITGFAQNKFSLYIYSGSAAQFGENQKLTIDANGNSNYWVTEVGKGVIDSASFTLTKAEMKEISDVLKQNNFYKLNKEYISNKLDGDGMVITVKEGSNTNTVRFHCKHIPEMDKIVKKINEILDKRKVLMGIIY